MQTDEVLRLDRMLDGRRAARTESKSSRRKGILGVESELAASGLGFKRQGLLHDAHNLLAAIELYCDLLSRPDVLRPEHGKYAEELRLLGRRSCDLLSQLVEATPASHPDVRIDEQSSQLGRRPFALARDGRKQPISLRTIVGASAGLLSRVAESCTVEFCYGPAASIAIGVDVESVERILLNLVSNAARATHLSGECSDREASLPADERRRGSARRPGRIRITVGQLPNAIPDAAEDRSQSPFQRVSLVVEDNGCGIAPGQVQRLLHGTEASPRKTHGIGFRVVRELVEQTGGELDLASEPGVGTRVRIQWPLPAARERETEPSKFWQPGNAELAQAQSAQAHFSQPQFTQEKTETAGIIAGGVREQLPVQPELQQEVS